MMNFKEALPVHSLCEQGGKPKPFITVRADLTPGREIQTFTPLLANIIMMTGVYQCDSLSLKQKSKEIP